MLSRTPALALDYLQVKVEDDERVEEKTPAQPVTSPSSPTKMSQTTGPRSSTSYTIEEEEEEEEEEEDYLNVVELGREKVIVRVVVGPSCFSISSGLLHRGTLLHGAGLNYSYPPYDQVHKLLLIPTPPSTGKYRY
jgi:hypothetical protein